MILGVEAKIGSPREISEAERESLQGLAKELLGITLDLKDYQAQDFPYCDGQGLRIHNPLEGTGVVLYDTNIPEGERTEEKMSIERESIALRLRAISENSSFAKTNNVQMFSYRNRRVAI